MTWNKINSVQDIHDIAESLSLEKPCVIFKHSTRCPISSMAWQRVNIDWDKSKADYFFLDLIAHRDVSNFIASNFDVMHESPQLLIIKDGKAIFNTSHLHISAETLSEQIKQYA